MDEDMTMEEKKQTMVLKGAVEYIERHSKARLDMIQAVHR